MNFSLICNRLGNGRILFFIFVFSLLAACSGGKTTTVNVNTGEQGRENKKSGNDEAPVNVSIGRSEARDVPAFIQTTGSLAADETSNVASPVSGQVISTPVNVGDFVSRGTVIARLDDRNARLELQQRQAAVRQAEAAVRQAEARLGLGGGGNFQASNIPEVRAANANYQQLLAEQKLAEVNEERYRDLVKTGDVAMILYDQYRTARDTARARTNSAKQQLDAAVNLARQNNQAIKTAQAAVDSARTQVSVAQKAIDDTVIRAPLSGFISERPIAVGENVSASSVIATILRSNPIKALLRIDEGEVPNVKIGSGVSIQVRAFQDRRFAGTVTAVNPSLDEASRSATIEAMIQNDGNLLRSGMFATGQIVRGGSGNTGVFVPKAAVYADNTTNSYRVFVIQEGLAKLRVVQLGMEENDQIQILSGVNPDEQLATSNLDKLYEGAKVQAE